MPQNSITYYQKHLTLSRAANYKLGEAGALANIGQAYNALEDSDRAIEYYEKAISILDELEPTPIKAMVLFNNSLLLYKIGNRLQAFNDAQLALKLFESLKHPYIGMVRRQLVTWEAPQGQAAIAASTM